MEDIRSEIAPDTAARAAAAAPSGGERSFEEVYLAYATRLRKIAVRKFHIPMSEAETLVHDVFATYFLHAASVRAVEPYLVGAICNAARHYLRRSDAAEAIFCAEVPCTATLDAAALEQVERKLLLSRLLARTGRRCRPPGRVDPIRPAALLRCVSDGRGATVALARRADALTPIATDPCPSALLLRSAPG